MRPSPSVGYTLGFSAAIVWAATSPGIKYLLDTFGTPALTLAFWRDAFIALALGAALLVFGKRDATGRHQLMVGARDLRSLALTGAISVGIYHALWVWSIVLNGAALAIVLIYTYPTFVTLGARLFFKERIGGQQIIALVLSFLGCVLLVRAYDPAFLEVSWLGTLVGLGTGITHAGYVLSSQRAVTRHSPWVTLMWTMLFGGLVLLVLTAVIQGPGTLLTVGAGVTPWIVLLVLALGPTLGGYALFTLSLRHLPGRVASLLVLIEAPISTGIAVVFLGERLVWPQVVGIVLILGAALLPALALRLPQRAELSGGVVSLGQD